MDRSEPIGNSLGVDDRRALHVKVRNSESESIPVYITSGATGKEFTNTFNTVNSVPSGSETLLVQYTVPLDKVFLINQAVGTGENIALFRLYIDNILVAISRTYFGGELNSAIKFVDGSDGGFKLLSGQLIKLTVEHNRPFVANFEGRLNGVLSDG